MAAKKEIKQRSAIAYAVTPAFDGIRVDHHRLYADVKYALENRGRGDMVIKVRVTPIPTPKRARRK